MRTTVTLDADTEALLKEEAARTGKSFKVVLNQAVKRALGRSPTQAQVEPLFPAPFPAELAEQNFNRLAAEWEDADTVKELMAAAMAAGPILSDAILASYAIEHRATLFTNDGDFARFPGLKWENPLLGDGPWGSVKALNG